MNKRIIGYILGWVLLIEGASMLLPTVTGVVYLLKGHPNEKCFIWFLITGAAIAAIGFVLVLFKPNNMNMYIKDGFAATALSWIVLSIAGAVPMFLTGAIPNFLDAVFESASGFTTTGATILTEIEHLPKCVLFWRCFTHFLGGMGVVVFLLALIPRLGGNQSINLMKAESTGPSVSKSMPKLRNYAIFLYGIYIGLTTLEVILLLFGGMDFFDALTTSFSTAGTGGFMSYNASVGHFNSHYLQAVIGVFMLLFGVNFAVYVMLITRKFTQFYKNEELWAYLGIMFTATALIAGDLFLNHRYPLYESIHQSFFYVSSIGSTTGMALTDTNVWPVFSKTIIIIITCIGACAGSTGGGFKVSRLLILIKGVKKEFNFIIHPRSYQTVKMDKKKVSHETSRTTSVFFVVYMLVVIVTTILISLDPVIRAAGAEGFISSFSSVLATLNNTGPGLGIVGSAGNYAGFTIFSKIIFIFNMLAGRLELYPLLLIFVPAAWKRN